MIRQSALESVGQYHSRFLDSEIVNETPSEISTADTDSCFPSDLWSPDSSLSGGDLIIPDDALNFIKGLKCPRCREFVVLRRPQCLESAFYAASQFELCYSQLPKNLIHDKRALTIMSARSESSSPSQPSPSTCNSSLDQTSSIRLDGNSEEEVDSQSCEMTCRGEQKVSLDDLGPTTAYLNSLLGRMKLAGVTQDVIDDYRKVFTDLHRNHFDTIDTGVREQCAREYLDKNRKYKYDHEKHQLHPYETHMTIKLAACTKLWHVGIKIPLMAIQIKKPKWMRRLFHKLPLCLSSPGLSYNT